MPQVLNISPEDAARELILRRDARTSMSSWVRLCGFEPAAHHQLIIEHLEALARREIKRLMVFLPPGSAKSTYSSVLFPPYFLAQRPNSAILCASHSANLAAKFGRLCRNLIDEHSQTLGYSLAKDSQAADEWATSHGCNYFCAGVGGRIAGHRADLGLIDDPFGSVQDADSLPIREGVHEWFEWNFVPRLKPNAAVGLISTRWHESDLCGKLLEKQASKWTVLDIPMLAKENDPLGRSPSALLWPEWFNNDMVAEAQKNPRLWQCAYQNDPIPETGDYFKEEWLVGYELSDLPTSLNIYAASDHACSTREVDKNDRTVLGPFGVDEGMNVWILPDLYWEVAETGTVVDNMMSIIQRHDPIAWIAERDHIITSIGPFLRQRLREMGYFRTLLVDISSRRDKAQKARSIQGRTQARKVFFPKFAEWWPKAEHELLSAWSGAHDDFCDYLSVIGRYLDQMHGAPTPIEVEEEKYMTYGWLKKQSGRKELAIESLMRDF